MIRGLFGAGSVYHTLRQGLNDDMMTARRTADRVANAANGDAAIATQQGLQSDGGGETVNLEEEIVRMVDTTYRYDAETRLLREAYSRLRTAIGTRG